MKREKTTEQRLHTYAMNQPMDDLDRHMQPTKTSTFLIYLLASPLLACGFWIVLLYLCVKES